MESSLPSGRRRESRWPPSSSSGSVSGPPWRSGVRRERNERRSSRRRGVHRRGQHARGSGRRRAPASCGLPARDRPGARRLLADRLRRARQYGDRRDERRDHALDLGGDLRLRLRLGMAPVVDRGRDGGPDRGAAPVRPLDEAVAATRPPRQARGAGRARGARRPQRDGLPRRRVALSAPSLPGVDLGDAPLPTARSGHEQLRRGGLRGDGRSSRDGSPRGRQHDRDRPDPGGSHRRRRGQPAHPRRGARRAQRGSETARGGPREPRRGPGSRAGGQLGVGHRREPSHVVGRALSPVGPRAAVGRDDLRALPRLSPSRGSRAGARGHRAGARVESSLRLRSPGRAARRLDEVDPWHRPSHRRRKRRALADGGNVTGHHRAQADRRPPRLDPLGRLPRVADALDVDHRLRDHAEGQGSDPCAAHPRRDGRAPRTAGAEARPPARRPARPRSPPSWLRAPELPLDGRPGARCTGRLGSQIEQRTRSPSTGLR